MLVGVGLCAPAHAQQVSITTAPDLGTIISAPDATTFTFAASSGAVQQSGAAIRRSSSPVRGLVSITCNVSWCNKNAGKITVQSNGSVSGRADAISAFTIAAGSGINITSGPNGSNPVTFNIAVIGSSKTVTFYVGQTVTLEGDNNAAKASGPAASGFRVTIEDTTKSSNNAFKDGSVTANVYHAIRIAVGTPLKFGRIVLPTSGTGTVAMQPSNSAAIPSAGAQLDPSKTTNGSFTVSGEAGTFYNLTVPSKITLSNGSNSFDMNISTTASGARQFVGTANTSVDFTFTIGGSFGFSSTTPGGAYTGSVPVTVQYQ